ncbi:hypothetical protein CLV46_1472 [Diaminobutyricimonas aerilata]|uniref:Uncharacterized protein n=1 Tax=Diaminobutyricimonas aerilata TaxID=1162967 RepID=A0A2M9CJ36_9MICO|nr:hypothetical protein [Diaminobutyricimonas aerilata]PJJ71916.1 hypothetical protein CLV46_1472 [Diaminobutyricimonas aerilata]
MAHIAPDGMPVLSAGRHRLHLGGACFMEYASYLAGERWSDHPRCTDGTLALLARGVNDLVPDEDRGDLVRLIPSVVGLVDDDGAIATAVAVTAAVHALPIANETRQRALAAGLLSIDVMLLRREDAQTAELRDRIADALELVPHATRWARDFQRRLGTRLSRRAEARLTDQLVETALLGIATACVPDPSRRLRALLAEAIDVALATRPVTTPPTPAPAQRIPASGPTALAR